MNYNVNIANFPLTILGFNCCSKTYQIKNFAYFSLLKMLFWANFFFLTIHKPILGSCKLPQKNVN